MSNEHLCYQAKYKESQEAGEGARKMEALQDRVVSIKKEEIAQLSDNDHIRWKVMAKNL